MLDEIKLVSCYRTGQQKGDSEELEEWLPNSNEGKTKGRRQRGTDETGEKKKVTKRVAKPKEPKPKAARKPRAARVPKVKKEKTNTKILPKPELQQHVAVKEEASHNACALILTVVYSCSYLFTILHLYSFWQVIEISNSNYPVISVLRNNAGDMPDECPSSSQHFPKVKKEEPDDSFTFNEPAQKKQKTTNSAQGRPIKLKLGNSCVEDLQMNWDPIQVLAEKSGVEQWVCANIVQLFLEENTIPFMVRYRKELINHMDADAVRDVQLTLEELRSVAKKSRSVSQTLKKEGVLTSELEIALKNCTTANEIDHVYAPYKKGSKLSKARRAKELGLEPVALALLQEPQKLDLQSSIQPNTKGLSTLDEVATGVQEILADMIAKDKETLIYQQPQQGNQKSKPKDIAKFSLYIDFTGDVQRIQHHQTLAINRGENLKILTVKVNIPDRVKNDFCRWCVNVRWRPQGFARPELMTILKNAVEDSYRRFILPFLSRGYRTKLTASAEKESIAMFVRNLRQRLLMCPVRGRVIMGVDPGFHHGCKIAILSPTSQILHTDVVYLHGPAKHKEAEKLCYLMFKHSCQTIVIGNGKACRETEAFFTDLIKRCFFKPLDVSYCITDEAGASIYSVSPEAVKEMPGMDPNLRSAVCIPSAELQTARRQHFLGVFLYQPHDVSQSLLRAALDGVVQECVSFVGVDINICSETLMRHIAGLNTGRARSIMEWKEKNGPFLNREQLKLVKGLGPKSFQQCAGFIRIIPETVCSSVCSGGNEDLKVPLKQTAEKKKVKGSGSTSNQFNPLDQTCIHPESYSIALRFLSEIGGSLDQMGSAALRQSIESSVKSRGLDVLAKSLDTTPETLQLIVDGLTQPPGFDIRQDFEQADFKREIVSMNDLHDGMVVTGRVTNTALFGAFVDIGVGRSGLIPKRFITPDKLPVDQRQRSLALGPGERVEVRVINVDLQRNRISLDLIRVLR
uniref:S1 RNA binding domain 1 n=1 Tax=Sinocyclocheilus grahami TaxID=75366 RepID=A0A672LHJ3_SINGR